MDWVDLLVVVYAGQDEEDAGPLGAAVPQPPQPEDDRPLVLLHHLDAHAEGDRDGDEEEEK